MELYDDRLGRLKISNLPVPAGIDYDLCTYTYSGSVLVVYMTPETAEIEGYLNVAVMNDDGTNFRPLFSGVEGNRLRCNGVRWMPFADNKRIHLGCNILECEPDIDHCEKATLVPVEFPHVSPEFDAGVWEVWTEIIISPDNVHMAWTELHNAYGANNYVGALRREKDKYVIEDVQCISSLGFMEKDPDDPSKLKVKVMRGGEVKEFVNHGTALSIAGGPRPGTLDSVWQDLASEELVNLSNTPGYDETTMLSPDDKLGIVMTSRFSPETDLGIFGLMPRPCGRCSTSGLTTSMYSYSIAGVRMMEPGNVGPGLIEVDRATSEEGYKGICLASEDSQWVYVSPISWHPSGKKAMWGERTRGYGRTNHRARVLELLDYEPGEMTYLTPTFPEKIPYAYSLEELAKMKPSDGKYHGIIQGQHSGYAEHDSESGYITNSRTIYHHFSNDGKTFWDGVEEVKDVRRKETVYEAKIVMSGEETGEMDLRATFRFRDSGMKEHAVVLDFGMAEDGKPHSYGFATYRGVTLRMEDFNRGE